MLTWFYKSAARRLFFALDAERAHELAMGWLSAAARRRAALGVVRRVCGAPRLPVRVFGMEFPNPVGLAAGFDKNGAALPVWEALGFGFVEIGTVTALAQPGNERPRLFRFPRQRALINRMGFNNEGAEAVARRLEGWRVAGLWPGIPVGINIGKSKVTPLEEAAADYVRSFRLLREYGDYFVVNVSSPNTPGLRLLQEAAALERLLGALQEENSGAGGRKPLLVKLAPDLSDGEAVSLIEAAARCGADGFVVSNTTVDHSLLGGERIPEGAAGGGLSGAPLFERSTALAALAARSGGLPVIGVGGIFTAADAAKKLAAGASLVQVYTGFVYEGPRLAGNVVRGLRRAGVMGEGM